MLLFIVIVVIAVVVFFIKTNDGYKKELETFLDEKKLVVIETKDDNNNMVYKIHEESYGRLEELFNAKNGYNLDDLMSEIADKKQHNPHFMAVYDTLEDYKNQLVAKKYFKDWGIEFTENKKSYGDIYYELTDESIERLEELYNTNKIFKNENANEETLEGSIPSSVANSSYIKSMMLEIRSQCDLIKENLDEEEFKKNNKKLIKDAIRSGGLLFNKDSKYFYCMTYTDFKIKEKLEDIVAVGIENRTRTKYDLNAESYNPHYLDEPDKPVGNVIGLTQPNDVLRKSKEVQFQKELAEYEANLIYVKQHNDEERRRSQESRANKYKTENYEVVVVVTKDTTVELPIETKHVLKSLLPDKVQY